MGAMGNAWQHSRRRARRERGGTFLLGTARGIRIAQSFGGMPDRDRKHRHDEEPQTRLFDGNLLAALRLATSWSLMKRFVLLAVILATSCAGFAQDIRDSSGTSTGKIEADGIIRNSSGTQVGRIDKDGTIRNSSGTGIGKVESDGTVRNSSGTGIGKVEADGTVRNSSGTSIGKVEKDGTVRNSSGTSIGNAKGIDRKWAAVCFFFFRFP